MCIPLKRSDEIRRFEFDLIYPIYEFVYQNLHQKGLHQIIQVHHYN